MLEIDLEKNSVLDKLYAELKAEAYPLFIWGAGSMSVEVEERLKEQGIPAEGFFVNEDIKKVHILPREKRLFSLEELADKYEKINVVIGHGHFEKRKLLEEYSFIAHIYIIPNPYLQYHSKGIGRYLAEHPAETAYVMEQLADEKSRDALEAYCQVNMTDDISWLLDKDFCINGMFGLEELRLTEKENYVDVGAWEGDTIELFLQKVSGKYSSIAAIEPDPDNYAVLLEKLKGKSNISFFPYGVGKESGTLYLDRGSTQSACFSDETGEQKTEIEIKTLDLLFPEDAVSLLKISVPFLFLEVLQGCKECIKRNKPRLIINVAADNGEKVFDTVKTILDMEMGYKIAFRFDFPMPTRLYLYAY